MLISKLSAFDPEKQYEDGSETVPAYALAIILVLLIDADDFGNAASQHQTLGG